ncbi:hyaluronidase PH-20-like [Oryx dammah]|uniref:hyaluronidase PH-20-like n=1 Tax=Oryx dammah TaxID=59534 RepID=UPI001A9C198C|nr:hyaluronidase PH-20-like [Oryx dammah]
MFRALTDKVEQIQEQMNNVSREIEVLRRKQDERLEIKNTVTEIEDIFDGLIIRLDTDEERSSDLKDISVEFSEAEKRKKVLFKSLLFEVGMLRHQYISFKNFVGSNGASQAVFTFLLIPCCLALDFTAPPLIPNIPFLWAWNAPTNHCGKIFGMPPDLSLFSLVGTPQKNVTGQLITLFYADRLGYYPHINERTGVHKNGGIPQMGSLKKHLDKAEKDITYYMPINNVGLAVIDWENWRPTWVRNWKPKHVYKNESIELVLQQNTQLSLEEAAKKAKGDFEKAAKSFMQETLKLGKLLRPKRLWGYYLFPDCYNHHYNQPSYNGSCFDEEKRRNDALNWLWKESTALYPSVYLNTKLKSSPRAALFVRNRVREAIRMSKIASVKSPLPVFVYTRPVFTDMPSKFLSQDDLVNTIGESIALGASGIIMWGSFNLSLTRQSCMNLDNYLNTILNPYIINVTLAAKMCSQVFCHEKGVCTRKDWNSTDYLHLNPVNFAIKRQRCGKYTIHGKPTLEDLVQFSESFYCSCYANIHCKKRDIKNIRTINVCFAEDICIEASLNSDHSEHSSSQKEISSTTFSPVSSSTPIAKVSARVPGKDHVSLKIRLSEEALSNTIQRGHKSVDWKNTFRQLYIQNIKNETNY